MMNKEEITKVFMVGKFLEWSTRKLKEFRNEFDEYIDKIFPERIILKNGIEIIAVTDEFNFIGQRNFRVYYSSDFMEICYKNKMNDLQQRITRAIEFLDKVREENGNEIGQVNYERLIEILGGKE